LNFLHRFRKKKTQTSNITKLRPVGANLFHAAGRTDRQTDSQKDRHTHTHTHTHMTKLIINFCNYAEAQKKTNHSGTQLFI